MGNPIYLVTMNEWMRWIERRLAVLERRRDNGGSSQFGIGAVGAESAERAISFIKTMLEPSTVLHSDAQIRPDVIWPSDYEGPVSGTYDIPMVGEPVSDGTPLVIAQPNPPIPASYRGQVNGSLNIPATTGMKVQAYKRTDTDYQMPSVADVDPASGFWFLDLSTTPDWQLGQWTFALLKNGTQVGQKWPYDKVYTNIKVENRVITDTSYLVGNPGTQPAQISGQFRFTYTLDGNKHFRLTRPNGDILAEYMPPTGAVRSYLVEAGEPGYGTKFSEQSYGYDQAVCLLAMIAAGEAATAARMVRGLLKLQTTSGTEIGGFIFSGSQIAPEKGDPSYRTGAHAFCAYALVAYVQAYPHDDRQNFDLAVTRALAWLDRYKDAATGLYKGGKGIYANDSGGPLDPNAVVPWMSSEHNFDAWHLWDLAHKTFGTSSYRTKADQVRDAIMTWLWNPANGRFNQGLAADHTPDTADPLDCHSWGAMFLVAALGDYERAASIMTSAALSPFHFTISGVTGYAPAYSADPGYPDATPTVWAEGTYGVALAYLAIRQPGRWITTMREMMAGQEPNGSYRYCNPRNVPYEWTNSKAVIGGAWSVMALGGHGIWSVEACPKSD
jgi:hypothetical protein